MIKILASVVALGIFASGFATTAQTVVPLHTPNIQFRQK